MENAGNYQLSGALRHFRDMSKDFLFLLSSLPSSNSTMFFLPCCFLLLLLIAARPPSLQRASVRLVESIDYHGAFFDGAVWLDACNCGVIKHWHRGFNGGLSNSLTFSDAQRGERAIYSCWRETKDVCSLGWKWIHSRVFMMRRNVVRLMYSLWFMY